MESLIGIKTWSPCVEGGSAHYLVPGWCHCWVEAGEREMRPGRGTSSSFFWALVRELLSFGPCPLTLPSSILNVTSDGSLPRDALSLMHHSLGNCSFLLFSMEVSILVKATLGDLSLSRPISSLFQNHFMTETKDRLPGLTQEEGSSGNRSQDD